jgi:hypothetical protein
MIAAIFFAAMVLAQNTPTAPPPPAVVATPAGAQVAAANDPTKARRDELLCKTEKVMGTLIPKKVCYTREQEEARTQEDRQNTERLQQSQYSTRNH